MTHGDPANPLPCPHPTKEWVQARLAATVGSCCSCHCSLRKVDMSGRILLFADGFESPLTRIHPQPSGQWRGCNDRPTPLGTLYSDGPSFLLSYWKFPKILSVLSFTTSEVHNKFGLAYPPLLLRFGLAQVGTLCIGNLCRKNGS